MHVYDQIHKSRIIAVVQTENDRHIHALASLCAHYGYALEITLRNAKALASIANVRTQYPDLLLMAGSVLSAQDADAAYTQGAQALVSPGFSERLAAHCLTQNYPYIPGVSSASDIMGALDCGLTVMKLFPAELLGGLGYLQSLAAVFRNHHVQFIPTGGISPSNLQDYLRHPDVFACGGTWLTKEDVDLAVLFHQAHSVVETIKR